MKAFFLKLILLFIMLWRFVPAQSSDSTSQSKTHTNLINFDDKLIAKLDKEYEKTEKRLTKQTNKWLQKIQKEEEKLKKQLAKTDSTKAEKIFGDIPKKYGEIESNSALLVKYDKNNIEQYIPINDSLQIATQFLNKLDTSNLNNLKKATIQQLSGRIEKLRNSYCKKEEVKKMLLQRVNFIKKQYPEIRLKELDAYKGRIKELTIMMRDYKAFLQQPDKLEKKLVDMVRDIPEFKRLFNNNSLYNSIFGTQQVNTGIAQGIAQVQTRAGLQTALRSQMPSSFNNPQQFIQAQTQIASTQIQNLKNNINSTLKKTTESNIVEPEINRANNIKKSKFWNNIEYGGNIQTQKQNRYFPVTSDVAFTIGYKLNTKSTFGIGSSYKLGWGNSIEKINLSSQGFGLRTYLDIKIKKQWWLYGGYERNFENSLTDLGVNNWQQSGLIGINKKINTKGKTLTTQLLYDFLYKTQQPYRQPIVFRIGYILNKK